METQFQFSALRTQQVAACSATAIGTRADMRRCRDNIPWGGPSLMANKPVLDKFSLFLSLSLFSSLSLYFCPSILISNPFVRPISHPHGHSSLVDIRNGLAISKCSPDNRNCRRSVSVVSCLRFRYHFTRHSGFRNETITVSTRCLVLCV